MLKLIYIAFLVLSPVLHAQTYCPDATWVNQSISPQYSYQSQAQSWCDTELPPAEQQYPQYHWKCDVLKPTSKWYGYLRRSDPANCIPCEEGELWNSQAAQCEPDVPPPNECDLATATAANQPLETSDTYTAVRGEYATSIKTGEQKIMFCSHFCEVSKTTFTSVTRLGADDYTILVTGFTAVNDTLCETPPTGGFDHRKPSSIPGKNDLYGSFDPPAGGCPEGSVYGQINGQDKCVYSPGGSGSGDNGSGGANNSSTDTDGDGITDSEDPDIDGDGTPNESDETPHGAGKHYGKESESFEGDDTSDFYDEDGAQTEAGDDLTFANVFANFRTRMEDAPINQGIENFFSLSISGSCPVYSVNTWIFTITFDQWCSNIMPWGFISGIMLALATFIAVRIAFT